MLNTTQDLQLTAVIITLNESKHIERCINHIKKLKCEIIVVDSGSTDGTIELAKRNGACVITHKWKGYSYARNLGASEASTDWILAIDADELINDDLAREISGLKLNKDHTYLINRLTYIGQTPVKHSDWFPDFIPRLYHRNQAHWEGEFVHEKLIYKTSGSVRLNHLLHHYSYANIEEHQIRMKRYALLSAQELHAKGVKYNSVLMYLKAAFKWFRTYIIKSGWKDGALGLYLSSAGAQSIRLRYGFLKRLNEDEKIEF